MGKKRVHALLALVVVCLLLNVNIGSRLLRRLSGDASGIKNAFTSVSSVINVPPIPHPSNADVPLYLALCQELIRQETITKDFPFRAFKVVEEDQDTCSDWSSPHMSLLEMFSSAMIAAFLPDIQYRHNCDHTHKATHFSPWLNFTTLQQAIDTISIPQDTKGMGVDRIKQQCRRCLLSYDEGAEVSRIKANGYHHCFAWPESNAELFSGSNEKPHLATIGIALDPIREVSYAHHSM